MSATTLALVSWEHFGAGIEGLHKFAKLVQVLATSWELLQKFLSRSQQKKLKVAKLRRDLLVIVKELRDAHFAIGQQNLLSPDDFLVKELAAALAAAEKACAADPRLYEMEVILDKAAFVQECVARRLLALTSPDQNTDCLLQTSGVLSTSSPILSRALQISLDLNDEGTSHWQCECRTASEECPTSAEDYDTASETDTAMSADGYDTASETDTDVWEESCAAGKCDDGYDTCNEDLFCEPVSAH